MIIGKVKSATREILVHRDVWGDGHIFATLYEANEFIHYTTWTPEQSDAVTDAIKRVVLAQPTIKRIGPQWVELSA